MLAILATAGLVIASIQTVQHLTLMNLRATGRSSCAIGGILDCDAVYGSRYSEVFAVPVSTWGAIAYLLLIASLVFAIASSGILRRAATGVAMLVILGAVLASVVLFGISLGVIHVLCPLCTSVHAINVALLVVVILATRRPVAALGWIRLPYASGAGETVDDSPPRLRRALFNCFAVLLVVLAGFGLGASDVAYLKIVSPGLDVSKELQNFLKAKPQDIDVSVAPSTGNPSADVTVVEYGDLECPTCRSAFFLYKSILHEYGDKVRLVFKHYPLDQVCNPNLGNTPHPHACLAAKAAVWANKQGKFWEHLERIYSEKRPLTPSVFREAGVAVGLDMNGWTEFIESKEVGWDVITKDIAEGRKAGVRETPAFFFNGRRAEAALHPRMIRAILDSLLAEQ